MRVRRTDVDVGAGAEEASNAASELGGRASNGETITAG
eukprot:COSAG03_NODE_19719_length_331_cov_0.767241_1_plen_37_part_01